MNFFLSTAFRSRKTLWTTARKKSHFGFWEVTVFRYRRKLLEQQTILKISLILKNTHHINNQSVKYHFVLRYKSYQGYKMNSVISFKIRGYETRNDRTRNEL